MFSQRKHVWKKTSTCFLYNINNDFNIINKVAPKTIFLYLLYYRVLM